MIENNTSFELRSEEVQEILTRVPHWMIRWGTVLVFIIIIMLFCLSWFIKYPDIITTQVVITTNIPPEKLVAKSSGRIQSILVADKSIIAANTPLAIIENPANFKDMFLLKSVLDTFKINNKESKFPFYLLKNVQLGDVESAFSIFQKDLIAYELNSNLQPYQVENKANTYENVELKERLNLLQQQKQINETELQLQKSDVNRFEILFNKGVVSAQDYEIKKLGYLQSEKNYKGLLSSISQLKSSLIGNEKSTEGAKISGKKEEVNLESNRIQSFYQLKKVIKDWELAYVLKSSIAGKVTFLQIWTTSQTIKAGDNAFSIIPTFENGYIGKVKAPAQNSGKIKIGQKVNIRLANFPNKEFGVLNGEVRNISLMPDAEGNLLLDISLPKSLKTNYNKKIPFQQEMSGSAEIVTEDLRLLERILYQFKDIFKAN
ncbi:HlyD family efflux transporter periplasmic adaptor subunit [Flavobacterium sp. P4023]|uniref:HlyD family efflux transporter periplasmic adaptor subunit n=1 Tax=Flavobacterium flabelliforme TaxID=2816119 RepID=A0ABS5CRY6_9FLAO|nr:HlyD family efflux transporter periplasmic adaptor subunit [Flavobacterium flabelliforme]MBP4141384.1 HlyD family efflux transporter periplasmic adaptor subunit [Flavobacterium flabelliforme]